MELPSVCELIYNDIRSRILSASYASGDRLNVDELARQFEASKTPVREALGRLERAGLVAFRARSGWSVTCLEMDEFINYLEMQFALRTFLSDNLAPFVDNIDFDLLRAINQKLNRSLNDLKYEDVIRQNDLFHMTIMSAHPNTVILNRLEDLDGLIRLQRVKFFERDNRPMPDVVATAHEQHQELIEALEQRDPERISRVSRSHSESTIKAYRLLLTDSQD